MTTATKERRAKAGGISLSATALRAALKLVSSVVPSKGPRPVLQSVLLKDGVLTGSDGEIRIDVTLEDAPPGCAFLLPADRFFAIVKICAGNDITVTNQASSCVISGLQNEWKLPTEDVANYPSWDVTGAKPITRLPADQFVRAVKGVVFAADGESSRYALGAVLVEVKGDVVTFVATDGRRLASVKCDHDQAVDDSETLVPVEAFKKCLSLMPTKSKSGRSADHEEDGQEEYDCDSLAVQIEATQKEVVITVGPMENGVVSPSKVLTALLLNGRFPRWRDLLADRHPEPKPTKVDSAAFLAATDAAAICSSEVSKGVTFTFSSDGIRFQAQSSDRGISAAKCGIITAGEHVSVKLDPVYVSQWIKGIHDKKNADPNVEVEVVDAQSAVILRCGDNTGVIMPMAVDG